MTRRRLERPKLPRNPRPSPRTGLARALAANARNAALLCEADSAGHLEREDRHARLAASFPRASGPDAVGRRLEIDARWLGPDALLAEVRELKAASLARRRGAPAPRLRKDG